MVLVVPVVGNIAVLAGDVVTVLITVATVVVLSKSESSCVAGFDTFVPPTAPPTTTPTMIAIERTIIIPLWR